MINGILHCNSILLCYQQTGSVTGAAFGVVDILRDSHAMKSAVKNNAVNKVMKSSIQYGT